MALGLKVKASSALVALVVLFNVLPGKGQDTPSLLYKNGKVMVVDLDKEVLYTFSRYYNTPQTWREVFPVRMKASQHSIPLDGSYTLEETSVVFTPRFPFAAGVEYLATFYTEQLAKNGNELFLPETSSETLQLEFLIAKVTEKRARVAGIFPSSAELPENLLKFHIQFDRPMSAGEVYEHVKLLDAAGNEVLKPFLEFDQEFWDNDMTMVTILFDPGRIKRGLRPNREMKPALKDGNRYSIVVNKNWKDGHGNPLGMDFEKSFFCVSADRTSLRLDPSNFTFPRNEVEPLAVRLDKPLDIVSCSKLFRVRDVDGNIIEGTFSAAANETVITFLPTTPWSQGEYEIEINLLAEDLAGNNFNKLFDSDLYDQSMKPASSRISFQVQSKGY